MYRVSLYRMYGRCSLHVECVECVLLILVMHSVIPLYRMCSLYIGYAECVPFI